MESAAERLAAAVREVGDGLLLAVTGAGVSVASGIPTFRGSDPGAIWKDDPMSLATVEMFRHDPVRQWRWYLARFDRVATAEPNPAHRALVALEAWHTARGGRFLLVTQNIDTLHEDAGTRHLIKVHGTADRVRCSRAGCVNAAPRGSLPRSTLDLAPFRAEPSHANLPRCPACAGLLRAHVLFFDEFYTEHRDYRFGEVERVADEADLMLFVGTSFSVGVTDLLLRGGTRLGTPMLSIDPAAVEVPAWLDLTALETPAEELLPAVCRLLGATPVAAAVP